MKCLQLAIVTAALGFCATGRAQELAKSDQIHIDVQQICPISGQKLGKHGAPIKVKIGEEHVFVCCQGCLKGKAVNPQHWATIHAHFAKAQRICPVMKKEFPANPKWTIVEGQIFYVCCPPCMEKIAADPKTYLRKLDELYSASLKTTQVVR
jgi:YHS domain-containing protein